MRARPHFAPLCLRRTQPWAALAAALWLAGAAWGERLPLRSFGSDDGLAHDFVRVVRQDSRGLLWVGTESGASRFDGVAFRNYGRAEGLLGGVNDVLETREGALLFATDRGVCRLLSPRLSPESPGGGGSFVCAAPGDSLDAAWVRTLHEDRGGRMWVGTGEGLYRLQGETVDPAPAPRFVRVPLGLRRFGSFGEGIREIVEDARGGLWLATAVGVAYRAPGGAVTQYRVRASGEDDRIFSLLLDRGGRLWIGHVDLGVFVWMPPRELVPGPGWSLAAAGREPIAGDRIRLPEEPGQAIRLARRHGLDDERVRTGLVEAPDGAVWIGTVRGLNRFAEGRLSTFGRRHGLADEGMRPSAIDSAGNLWLGSPSGGAMRLRRGGLTSFDESDGLRGLRIRALFTGRDGALYVLSAAERDHVHRFDGERFEASIPALPPGVAYAGWWNRQVGLEDHRGEWWLPSAGGLLRYPPPRRMADLATPGYRIRYQVADGLPSPDPQVLYEDRLGDVWIGSFAPPELAVWRRRSGRFERLESAAVGLPSGAAPTVFREDGAGRLWIGFGNGVLGHLAGGSLVRIPSALLPGAAVIQDLHFDVAGRLWVATVGGGLIRLDEPAGSLVRALRYGTESGLASDDVACVAEDQQGRIYAGTDQGVARLDPESGAVDRFTSADGLANNLVTVAHRDPHGDLWFGTMQGLSRLRPAIDEVAVPSPVLIAAVEAAGVPHHLSETGDAHLGPLRLGAGVAPVRFGFVAPSASADVAPLYRYRLEGAEPEWSAPTHDRAVTYAGLAPGSYRFTVEALHAGAPVGAPAIVELVIPPPWWRRWWTLAAMGGLAVGAVVALHRQRLARVVAVERVRSRIAADLHDDLGASLSRIAVLSEVASRRSDGAERELRQIADTARQLTDEASDMVWSIDPAHDDLESLLVRLRRLAGDLLAERGIALEWSVPPGTDGVRLPADQRRHLLLVLKEALHNAARHAGATRVGVRVEWMRGVLSAEVSDDGRGFDPDAPRPAADGGRGLANLRVRARAMGAELAVRSVPGHGTTIALTVPRGTP